MKDSELNDSKHFPDLICCKQ